MDFLWFFWNLEDIIGVPGLIIVFLIALASVISAIHLFVKKSYAPFKVISHYYRVSTAHIACLVIGFIAGIVGFILLNSFITAFLLFWVILGLPSVGRWVRLNYRNVLLPFTTILLFFFHAPVTSLYIFITVPKNKKGFLTSEKQEVYRAGETVKEDLQSAAALMQKAYKAEYTSPTAASEKRRATALFSNITNEANKTLTLVMKSEGEKLYSDVRNINKAVRQSAEYIKKSVKKLEETVNSVNNEETEYIKAQDKIRNTCVSAEKTLNLLLSNVRKLKRCSNLSPLLTEESDKAEKGVADLRNYASGIQSHLEEAKVAQSTEQLNVALHQIKTLSRKINEMANTVEVALQFVKRIKTAAQGSPQEKYELSKWFLSKNDNENYNIWLGQAAEDGCADAEYEIGLQEYETEGKTHWLERAANSGSIDAKVYLYAIGKLIGINEKELFGFLERAADTNDNYIAMLCLGELYCLGEGTYKNTSSGYSYIKRGASARQYRLTPEFWMRIGKLFYNKNVCFSEYMSLEESVPFFQKAATLGDREASKYLEDIKKRLRDINEEERKRKAEEQAKLKKSVEDNAFSRPTTSKTSKRQPSKKTETKKQDDLPSHSEIEEMIKHLEHTLDKVFTTTIIGTDLAIRSNAYEKKQVYYSNLSKLGSFANNIHELLERCGKYPDLVSRNNVCKEKVKSRINYLKSL